MKTLQEIELELGEAAKRMTRVNKAAKDQSALTSAEPADIPRPNLGEPQAAPLPVVKPER